LAHSLWYQDLYAPLLAGFIAGHVPGLILGDWHTNENTTNSCGGFNISGFNTDFTSSEI